MGPVSLFGWLAGGRRLKGGSLSGMSLGSAGKLTWSSLAGMVGDDN